MYPHKVSWKIMRGVWMFLISGRSVYTVFPEMNMNDTASVARIVRWGRRNKGTTEKQRISSVYKRGINFHSSSSPGSQWITIKREGNTTSHGIPTIRDRSLRATLTFGFSLVYANLARASVFACGPRNAARNAFFRSRNPLRRASRCGSVRFTLWFSFFYSAKTVRSVRPPVSPDVIVPLTLADPLSSRARAPPRAQGPHAFSVARRRPSSWVHGFRQMRAER